MPRAVELAPDLVSLAAGGNDILRGTDVDELAALFEPAVAKLQAAGSRVLIFTGFDPRMFPVIRLLRGRIAAYNMHLRGIADEHGCDLVDLWSMRALKDARAWSPDRLHLTTEGHRQVARRACEVLGIPVGEDWRVPPPPARPPRRPERALAVAGRAPPGRPLGQGVRGPLAAAAPGRHVQRRRSAAQAPRPSPGLTLRARRRSGGRHRPGLVPHQMLLARAAPHLTPQTPHSTHVSRASPLRPSRLRHDVHGGGHNRHDVTS